MTGTPRGPQSTLRLFTLYAAITLIPVLVLGIVLANSFRSEANRRGMAEGRSEAKLVAQTAVEPLLTGHPLSDGINATERTGLQRLVARAIGEGDVLRLRVRDLSGNVVFSDDGSGLGGKADKADGDDKAETTDKGDKGDDDDDEALDAAGGEVVAHLTHLNSDANDTGRIGPKSVEVYLPLNAGDPIRRVGVLELYLPYAPISRDVTAGLRGLYLDLAVGLGLLYLALFAITVSVSRGLRREVSYNAFLAEHDTLTELPNRTLFLRRATSAVHAAARREEPVAIAIVDLDRFKDVNDTLGHHNGDRLLTELARRLAAHMRPGDTVARLGGDEFGLVLRDVADAESALERLREVIDREVELSGLPLSVQASVGYAIAPDDGTDVDDLLQRADVAMYIAKAQHAGATRYDSSLDHYDAASLSRVSQLRRAIDEGQLVLHYQPQSTLVDHSVRAVEALVRWQHPTDGLLYPGSFLPLAEQTDVIEKLTRWVLRTALAEIRELDPADDGLCVAVNVSARSIGRKAFADDVMLILDDLEMPPGRLIVEVTETALLADPERAAAVLARLADAGVRISLDDFGQGQTSLGYLSALPLHELKIDRSFIADMLDNAAHAAIVRSIIDLGHNLSLRVVGEGVETEDVLARLDASGCDVAQGFLLARPMPLADVAGWLGGPARSRAAA
jgi:diguanylate cyclase (GGDEF)-like protein